MTASPSCLASAPATAQLAASGGGPNRSPAARPVVIASSNSRDLPLKAKGPIAKIGAGPSIVITGGPASSAIGAAQAAGGLTFGVQSGNGARLTCSNPQQ